LGFSIYGFCEYREGFLVKIRWFAAVAAMAAVLLMFSACGDDADYDYEYSDENYYTYEIRIDTTADGAVGGNGGAIVPISEFQRMWTADIEQLREHVLTAHPYFSNTASANTPASIVLRQVFNAHIDLLLYQLPNLDEFGVTVALQRALALFQSMAFNFPPFLEHLMHRFLLQFHWLGDGLYLGASCENSAHALNSRLVSVNGVPIEDIVESSRWLLGAENAHAARMMMGTAAASPALFNALGISDGDVTTYSFIGRDGIAFNLYKYVEQAQDWGDLVEFWGDIWITQTSNYDALFEDVLLMHQQRLYNAIWHEHWDELNALYIRITNNTFLPIPGYNDIRRILRTYSLDGTILDLRSTAYWSGDLSTVVLHLLDEVSRRTSPEGFFVLIDEYTQILEIVLYLESIGATIVGRPPLLPLRRLGLSGVTLANRAILDYSQIHVLVPNHIVDTNRHGVARDFPGGLLMPHVLIEHTIDDWYYNTDPWLDFVKERLQ